MREEVFATVRNTLGKKEVPIQEETRLEDILEDSMDAVELIVVLSNTYKISADPSELKELQTVGQLVEYVITRAGKAHTQSPLEAF